MKFPLRVGSLFFFQVVGFFTATSLQYASAENWIGIRASHNHVCRFSDSRVQCWGYEFPSGLNETITFNQIRDVQMGGCHACVLDADGIWCFGNNNYGQSEAPFIPEASSLSSGEFFSCALAESLVECWGRETYGETSVPFKRARVLQVTSHSVLSYALLADGILWAWGDLFARPLQVRTSLKSIFSGGYDELVCGVDDWGTKCWSQIWKPNWSLENDVLREFSRKDYFPEKIAIGREHLCGLSDGKVDCWGEGAHRQTLVPSDLSDVIDVAAGNVNTCALTSTETVCWGSDWYGVLDIPEP